MAIVRFGPLATAVSGSIGTVTFVHRKGSPVARRRQRKIRHVPEGFPTPWQALSREMRDWIALGEQLQAEWRAYASTLKSPNALGTPKKLTGRQVFLMCNVPRWWLFWPGLFHPPDLGSAAPPTITSTTLSAAGFYLMTFPSIPLEHHVGLWAARSCSATAPSRTVWKFLDFKIRIPNQVNTLNFTVKFKQKLGALQQGELTIFRVKQMSWYSMPSPWATTSAVVGP